MFSPGVPHTPPSQSAHRSFTPCYLRAHPADPSHASFPKSCQAAPCPSGTVSPCPSSQALHLLLWAPPRTAALPPPGAPGPPGQPGFPGPGGHFSSRLTALGKKRLSGRTRDILTARSGKRQVWPSAEEQGLRGWCSHAVRHCSAMKGVTPSHV